MAYHSIGPVEVLGAIVLLCIGIWYYLSSTYGYWKRQGIPGPEPKLLFGNFKDIVLGKAFIGDGLQQICKEYPGAPMIGVYEMRRPLLILCDLDLLQDVLIKDFSNFSERGDVIHEKKEPLTAHLVTLETKRWRFFRPRLSPIFTAGKMRKMFSLIQECADHFEKYLHVLVDRGEPIDCRELSAKFTTDVIGSCAFGLNFNAIADDDSEFRKIGRKLFTIDRKRKFLLSIRSAAPWLYKLLGISASIPGVTEFFIRTVTEMLEYRTKNNVQRGDLIDTLNEIKQEQSKIDFELTDGLITAQAFVFFVAGFETSSSTISAALYELAQHQDVQDKVRQEILDSSDENNGEVTYESVKEMKYLHMVFQETLRLRCPVSATARAAMNDYTFRGTNVTIRKGQKVLIPISLVHMDPENYPNPDIFDPERFTEENIKSRHPMSWLAFGDGPRNCIGARFAVYQTKLGLIKILSNFKVETCEKTQIPFVANPTKTLLEPLGGILLKFTKLDKM
ncbi:cytochrome P450 6a2-like [Athalia rosae]|uniref:cytochrome P450 6a2-like n=1 Tax=Athalia rosae TaxID=37344 RepID=UPI0020335C0D|nr:cytochrome P450 6a2-like [Athalia rosae]